MASLQSTESSEQSGTSTRGADEESVCCEPQFEGPTLFPYFATAGSAGPGPISSYIGSGSAGTSRHPNSLSKDNSQASEKREEMTSPTARPEDLCTNNPKGRCSRCGIKTHTVSVFVHRPMTTSDVYKGRCIRCNPLLVPWAVRNQWEIQNAALLVQDEVGSASSHVRGYSGVEGPVSSHQPKAGPSIDDDFEACMEINEAGADAGGKGAEDTKQSLSEERLAKKPTNRCPDCGIRTHKNILGKRFPVTTATVFEGHCIKCSPLDVPLGVLQKWQVKSLGEHVKNLPDGLEMELDMESPSIPSAGVKVASNPGQDRSSNNNMASTMAQKSIPEESDELLLAKIVATMPSDAKLDWTTLNELITKPSVLCQDELAKADSKEDVPGALPISSRVGVPVARMVRNDDEEVANDNEDRQVQATNVAATADIVYASQVELLKVRKGHCQQCGEVKTHRTFPYSLARIPITNCKAYKGRCRNCHPELRTTKAGATRRPKKSLGLLRRRDAVPTFDGAQANLQLV